VRSIASGPVIAALNASASSTVPKKRNVHSCASWRVSANTIGTDG
jgi:hypothetical protein